MLSFIARENKSGVMAPSTIQFITFSIQCKVLLLKIERRQFRIYRKLSMSRRKFLCPVQIANKFRFISFEQRPVSHYCQIGNKKLYQIVDFARRLPHMQQLPREDQITMIRFAWIELLILSVAFQSIEVKFVNFLVLHKIP